LWTVAHNKNVNKKINTLCIHHYHVNMKLGILELSQILDKEGYICTVFYLSDWLLMCTRRKTWQIWLTLTSRTLYKCIPLCRGFETIPKCLTSCLHLSLITGSDFFKLSPLLAFGMPPLIFIPMLLDHQRVCKEHGHTIICRFLSVPHEGYSRNVLISAVSWTIFLIFCLFVSVSVLVFLSYFCFTYWNSSNYLNLFK
jgi:hypothetical protein